MEIFGDKLFAKDAEGKLLSRIGTLFFRTPGLVTKKGVHAMQRMMWIEEINRRRAEKGEAALTMEEEDAEMAESADLIFTEEFILIRPDPERMDLAVKADLELQKMVSKRKIRFLNTSAAKVRSVLRARGENWRMARHPISQDDMTELIENSKVPICEKPIYYYNRTTGTRYITASGYEEVKKMPDADYRRQVNEVIQGLSKRNRLGQPEVDVFPVTTPPEIKKSLRMLKIDSLSDTELRRAIDKIATDWRMTLPTELRDETPVNFEWRNEMCDTITKQANETSADEQELIAGISSEFYRQIEWLPGARIEDGEVIFDEIYDEAARTQDPELLEMCDNRVKSFLFNTIRLFGSVEYINIGRITNTLSRVHVEGNRRGHVYVMQYKESGAAEPKVMMIRLQKWGVAEHLDEGKNLLESIVLADEYSDFILDRRLMCRQLGMNLPKRLGFGRFTEKYRGNNHHNGCAVRTAYFARAYVPGIASDKLPLAKYRNPAFAQKFAFLFGQAAAVDMIVGRCSSVTKEPLFDNNYEVVAIGDDGFPMDIRITDHAGSFVNYERDFSEYVANYAVPVLRRRKYVTEYENFALAYIEGFRRRFVEVQESYRANRRAYDTLFRDRPYDTNGSGAYRWARALQRLDAGDVDALVAILKKECGC